MPKKYCLCGVNVTTATKVFGWIFLILKLLTFFANLGYFPEFLSEEHHNWLVIAAFSGLFFDLTAIVCVSLLLYGTHKKRPSYYWAFLIYSFILVVLLCIPLILYAVIVVVSLFDPQYSLEEINRAMTLFVVIFVAFAPIQAYFGFVVPNRSRKLLLDERYKALLGY